MLAGDRGDRHLVRTDEGQRIDRRAFDADFIMEVVAGRTAGRTDIAENIALLHLLPGAHDVGGHMAVARLDRIAMFDLDIIAIAAEALSAADEAVGGRIDRGERKSTRLNSMH